MQHPAHGRKTGEEGQKDDQSVVHHSQCFGRLVHPQTHTPQALKEGYGTRPLCRVRGVWWVRVVLVVFVMVVSQMPQ